MTKSKIKFAVLAAVVVLGSACADNTPGDGTFGSADPGGDSADTENTETEATEGSAGSADEFSCDVLDESAVRDIIGEGGEAGFVAAGSTVNDVQFESRGCQYDMGDDAVSWEVRLSTDTEVFDQLEGVLDDAQQVDVGGQPALLDAGPFNISVYIQVEQGMLIVEADPDGDAEEPSEDQVLQLSQLAVDALG